MKKNRNAILFAIFLSLIGALLVVGTSYAFFTDSAQGTNNIFLAGNLQVRIDQENEPGYFNISNLLPGDSGSNTITISNPGTLTLSYNIMADLTGELAEGAHPLVVTFRDTEDNPVLPENQRLLAPDEEETLTIIWQMPIEAGNEYQGKTAQMGIIVQASQRLTLASFMQ